MDPGSILGGLSANALWDRIKKWFPIGDSPESPVRPQAEGLVDTLDDEMDTQEDVIESMRREGGFTIEHEVEREGVINRKRRERKSVDFSMGSEAEVQD
jgi:hypothetical protein